MTGGIMTFRVDPFAFVTGEERPIALKSLQRYFAAYSGRCFEQFADASSPNRFTPSDMLAVSMLSVTVPAEAAIWLTGDPKGEIEELLGKIPADAHIWDADANMTAGGDGWKLWDLLRAQPGLGRTITSKLLAAKRPHLFPIYDSHVGAALLADQSQSDWAAWRERFTREDAADRVAECEKLRTKAGLDPSVSVLRTLDVGIWMRVHGDRDLSKDDRFWESI